MKLIVASPKGYELDAKSIAEANAMRSGCVAQMNKPQQAVKDADVIYTDTWVSMGQEEEKERRCKDFAGYQVNSELLAKAPKGAKIMHCLPAYRGFEITDEAAESENSIIFQQAENRLHFQRALLKKLMAPKK
jgi:ornithine carbamoyltransferase